jgi:hypothetical protein
MFWEPTRTNRTLDLALTRIQIYFRAPSRQEAHQCRCPFTTTLPRGAYVLPQFWGTGSHQTSTNYRSRSRSRSSSRLGCGGSENGAFKRPKDRTHSTGGRNRAAIGMDRHRRPQPHTQIVLGSVEIACCEKRRTGVQLGICKRTISNRLNSSSSEQSGGCVDQTIRWIVRRSLGYHQIPE